jgi:hypothetical protein
MAILGIFWIVVEKVTSCPLLTARVFWADLKNILDTSSMDTSGSDMVSSF